MAACVQSPHAGATRVDHAITSAAELIISRQEPDGRWHGIGTFTTPQKPDAYGLTALYVLFLNRLGVDDESKQKAIRYLLTAQLPNGGWGDASADFGAVLALRQVGVAEDSDPVRRARANIQKQGASLDGANLLVKLFYALDGQYSWDRITAAGALSSPDEARRQLDKTIVYARDAGAAIAILRTLGPKTTVSRQQLEAIKNAESLLLARQLPTGSWLDYEGFTIIAALALHELGYQPSSLPIRRALEYPKNSATPGGSYRRVCCNHQRHRPRIAGAGSDRLSH